MEQTIFDVANWFLSQSPLTHKKLQKLCYYAEAWSEALLGTSISKNATFEAWVHGPVNYDLWRKYSHYGWNVIKQAEACPDFPPEKEEILGSVWLTYKGLTGTQLETLTHREDPWKNQRVGLSPFERSNNIIQVEDMAKYYRALYDNGD